MLCTTDPTLFRECWAYTQHGKDHDEAISPHSPDIPGSLRWMVRQEGTNLRMTEMQAASAFGSSPRYRHGWPRVAATF